MTRATRTKKENAHTKKLSVLEYFSLDATGAKLKAAFKFDTHLEALVFIARITVHAEVLRHHPDITFTYKKVAVTLTTHDAKTLTEADFTLASKIETLYNAVDKVK